MADGESRYGLLQGERYYVKLPAFEGPFDLLHHLISKEEVDIWEIPLGKIAEEFLQYLRAMEELKVDLAGDFLVIASSLLRLKSRLLLPQAPAYLEENEEELLYGSKEELVRSLLEYRKFKAVARWLQEKEAHQERIYIRSRGFEGAFVVNRQSSFYPYAPDALMQAVQRIKKRQAPLYEEKSFPVKQEISFRDKMVQILKNLRKMASPRASLEDFLSSRGKEELVATFFALLELSRKGRLRLRQEELFGKILIFRSSRKERRSG